MRLATRIRSRSIQKTYGAGSKFPTKGHRHGDSPRIGQSHMAPCKLMVCVSMPIQKEHKNDQEEIEELKRASLIMRAQSYRRRLFSEFDRTKEVFLP